MSIRAVVIGTDHINTLGVVRSLGEVSVCVDILILCDTNKSNKKSWVSKSRYIRNSYYCGSNEEEIIHALLNISQVGSTKAYLFPCSDFSSLVIDKYREQIESYYYVPGIIDGCFSLERLMDKSIMVEKAKEAGFRIPKTRICDFSQIDTNEKNKLRAAFAESYPLLIRSCGTKSTFGKYEIINDESRFVCLLNELKTGKAIIQEYIEKEEELGIQGVAFGGTNKPPVIPGVIHKKRTSLISPGSTTYATIDKLDYTIPIDQCMKFINICLYSGIFDIEVIRRGNDYFFVECNFRNGAYGYAYTKDGFNLPFMWIKAGSSLIDSVKKEMYLMNEFNDIRHVRVKNIGFSKWLKQFLKSDIHLTVNKKDIHPFIFRLIYSFHA